MVGVGVAVQKLSGQAVAVGVNVAIFAQPGGGESYSRTRLLPMSAIQRWQSPSMATSHGSAALLEFRPMLLFVDAVKLPPCPKTWSAVTSVPGGSSYSSVRSLPVSEM